MYKKLLLIGAGDVFNHAKLIINQLHLDNALSEILLHSEDGFNFDLPDLGKYPTEEWHAFVALDERGLNLSRAIISARLKALGYSLAKIISPMSTVLNNGGIGENVLIAQGAYVGSNVVIGFNSILHINSFVSDSCRVGKSCFVGPGSILEYGVFLGDNVTIGSGELIKKHTEIGKYCELRHRGNYEIKVDPKTFFIPGFERELSVISPL